MGAPASLRLRDAERLFGWPKGSVSRRRAATDIRVDCTFLARCARRGRPSLFAPRLPDETISDRRPKRDGGAKGRPMGIPKALVELMAYDSLFNAGFH